MVKHFAQGLRIFLLLALLLMLYAVLWLQAGVRDMNWTRGWLTDALNPEGAPYAITVGDVSVRWRDITELGDLRVTDMRMSRRDGGVFATIPQVRVSLDPFGFLPHRRALQGITIDRAHLFLTRDAQGVMQLGVEGVQETLPAEEFLGFFASDEGEADNSRRRLPFREINLNDAALLFTDVPTNRQLKSDHFSFRIGRTGRDLHGRLVMPFTYNDRNGGIGAALNTDSISGDRVLSAKLVEVPSELLCILATCPADVAFAGNVSGKFSLKHHRGAGLVGGSAALTTKGAYVEAPKLFPERLHLLQGEVIGRAGNQFHDFAIDGLTVKFPDTKIGWKGTLQQRDDGWYVKGEAVAGRLDLNKLYKYWPLTVAPDTRSWVVSQLHNGWAESSDTHFDMHPSDLTGDVMRDAAIRTTILVHGADIDYVPGFPVLKNVDGTVKFTGKTMRVDAQSGSLLTGTVVHKAVLVCPDLDAPRTPMTTNLELTAPASDAATLFKLKPFTFDDQLNLDPATITGSLDSSIELGFDAFSGGKPATAEDINLSGVHYNIDATLHNVAQPKLLQGRDIAGINGALHADDAGAHFDGSVKLGGTDAALVLNDAEGVTTAAIKGTIAREQFANFGIPELEQIGQGSIGVDAELLLTANATALRRAKVDLTPVAMNIDEIGWSKPIGAAAHLTIAPGAQPRAYDMSLTAPDLSVGAASIVLNETMDDVTSANLQRVKTGASDFSLRYGTKPDGGYLIGLSGAALDASKAYSGTPEASDKKAAPKEDEKSLLGNFPSLDLDVDVQSLTLVKEHPLRNLKGSLRCDTTRCNTADFHGQTGQSDVRATIAQVQGKRQLEITGSDAGDFLRAVDISDRVYGGTLSLKGVYDDTKTPAPFDGRMIISKFKLKNSQILARIISIGSLSGLANVLTGSGIEFDKFGANIYAVGGVINVKHGRADSNALGLTLEGKIDTNRSNVNLKGVVVPANSLNSLFGKLPIIGKLAGGEGEGLIAFNYSMKGAMDDPQVFVNPLSGLTPGFLRGIFRIGDQPPEGVPAEAPAENEAPAPAGVPWPGAAKPEVTPPASVPAAGTTPPSTPQTH